MEQPNSILIDQCLPKFEYQEKHHIIIDAKMEDVYPIVRHLDFQQSWIARALFKLRGLPFESLALDTMLESGSFALIAESPPEEFVIGMLGSGQNKPVAIVDKHFYSAFREDNGLKIAWNFYLAPHGGQTCVSTETRIQCLGSERKRKFGLYWFFIRPFSGLIRKEMLRLLKKQIDRPKYEIEKVPRREVDSDRLGDRSV